MHAPGPVRLCDLVRDGKLLWCYCRACGHEVDVDPATLPLPGDTPVPLLRERMRCSRCGSKKVDVKPELYPGGVAKMRGRGEG